MMAKQAVQQAVENVDRFLFHKDHAPEGQFFSAADDDPDGAGWHDTPEKFDPKYKAPPPPSTEPGTVPDEARKKGFVPTPYPSHRFHIDGVQEKLVHTAEDDEAHDPKVWKHSPDPKTWDEKPRAAKAAAAAVPAAAGRKRGKASKVAAEPGSVAAAPAPAADGSVVLTDAQIAAFYKSGIGEIAAQLEAVQSLPMLTALAEAEATNAKPRAAVAKAIKARTKALQVGSE